MAYDPRKPYPYKTKKGLVKGREVHMMICSNSSPEHSKYGDWAPEDGPCTEWVQCSVTSTAVLCSKCVQRTLTRFPRSSDND